MSPLHKARFYEPLPKGKVLCTLCPHDCRVAEGVRGACSVRYNHRGKLYTLVYDKVVAREVNPIENKPLFHFHPGSFAYSISTVGCSLRCSFCQNWYISHLQPILDAICLYRELGVWVEVTTLVIPGLNDSDEELRQIAVFIHSIGKEIPWHVTAFYPAYRMRDRPPTDIATLRRAREIGLAEGLRYVYQGNVPGEEGENTYCCDCKRLLIKRFGFSVMQNRIREDGRCPDCGSRIDGIGMSGPLRGEG